MRNHAMSRGRLFVVCVLGALASVVPTAGADTTAPNWTCRASALYVETSLLQDERVEPVLANGFVDGAAPDTAQCASADAGVQDVEVPGGAAPPIITLESAFASTRITPQIAAARDQSVTADGGVLEPLEINLGPGLVITANAVTAHAQASCVAGAPQLSGTSDIISLTINGTVINVPNTDDEVEVLALAPLIEITLNEKVHTGAGTADEQLTQRAIHIRLLALDPADPVANVVIGEAKVDRHGAVCAPPATPVCPGTSVLQPGTDPPVCLDTVTNTVTNTVVAPCPATAPADASGACILPVPAPPVNCPAGSTRDPATNNCIQIRDRPCPTGATPDPATRVCVVTNAPVIGSGENGRVGSADGPVATCGRLEMHFVRGRSGNAGRSFTSRFGTRTVTRGRLVTCGSNPRPIVGARVDVVHVLPGNKRRRKTGLRSRFNGLLTLILPIDLRSRSIDYAYRPDLRSTRVTSRVILRLTVKSRSGRTLR